MFDLFKREKNIRKTEARFDEVPAKPVGLYGQESSRPGCFALVYIGNGASGQDYEDRFAKVGADGVVHTGIGGKANLCAIQYCEKEEGAFPPMIQGFTHREGIFHGFTIRRKREGSWEWICVDEQWHRAAHDMPEKILYQEGDRPAFGREEAEVFVCEAKWADGKGEILDCGYRMFRNPLMAHSFGAMKGKAYHNTIPSYKNGIRNGYKYFEVDLSMTVDERLVLCHGWQESNCVHTGFKYSKEMEENMTYDRIMKMKVHGNRITDARDFYSYIKKNPDHMFEIDFHKYRGEAARTRVRLMLEDFRYDEDVLDQLLVQAVNRGMYAALDSGWHFEYYQYLVGKAILDVDNLINFMLDEGICAAALRVSLAKKEPVEKLRNAGIYTLVYTVRKDVEAAKTLLDNGVNTICTDFITPEQLRKQEKGMGHYPFHMYYHSGERQPQHSYKAPDYHEDAVAATAAGCLEYRDPQIWENDGKRQLAECRFEVPGKRFAGWNLRMKADDIWFWYCDDGYYRTRGEFGYTEKTFPHLFKDKEQLPVFTVKQNANLVMTAVWEPLEEDATEKE